MRWTRTLTGPGRWMIAAAGRARDGRLLDAVVADVRRRQVVRFPHTFIFDKPTGAEISAGDGANELSTEGQDSSGRITFTRVRCGKRLDIRFRVDAVIDSEFHDAPPVAIRGTFSARG